MHGVEERKAKIKGIKSNRAEDVDKEDEVPNSTIQREATCHVEERKTKDDGRKER